MIAFAVLTSYEMRVLSAETELLVKQWELHLSGVGLPTNIWQGVYVKRFAILSRLGVEEF